ncbi:MAG: radical SAM family heme chaperone HemW [Pikeienuella sp.]
MQDWQHAGFGVYVHWPFCLAKCPYCDFNSHVSRVVDHERWRKALVADLKTARAMTGPRPVDTIFFGGGTPSLMEAETVAAVITAIDDLWGLQPGAEISLEANPTSIEAGRFRDYAAAGVNRVSMGAQALNDADLKALGRMHSAAEAMAAFDIARAQFDRVSFDLIYARQNQTVDEWKVELRQAIDMAVDHLSLYQLTIEHGTRFGELHARGALRNLPTDDRAADMYFATQEVAEAAGLPAYEISNHARPGAESRHNKIYWRYGDYVGVGPGAHGRVTTGAGRVATSAPRDPATWLELAERGGQPDQEALSAEAMGDEYAMMALRLTEGVDEARFAALSGTAFNASAIDKLAAEGLLHRKQGRIAATAKGRPILNYLIRELLV